MIIIRNSFNKRNVFFYSIVNNLKKIFWLLIVGE